MNELIYILEALIGFSTILLVYKFFGKLGLYFLIPIYLILANTITILLVQCWGMTMGLGVSYGMVFLCTDILSEKYGKKSANEAVRIGFVAMIIWLVLTQIALLYIPHPDDWAKPLLSGIWYFLPRITLASFCAYGVSQTLDVYLYHWIWERTGDKYLWLRNNGGTLISQTVDGLIFTFVAFWGIWSKDVFMGIIISSFVMKYAMALVDTPFLYLAKKIIVKPKREVCLWENENP